MRISEEANASELSLVGIIPRETADLVIDVPLYTTLKVSFAAGLPLTLAMQVSSNTLQIMFPSLDRHIPKQDVRIFQYYFKAHNSAPYCYLAEA